MGLVTMDSIEGFISDFWESSFSTKPNNGKKKNKISRSPQELSRPEGRHHQQQHQQQDQYEEQREDDDTTVATSNTKKNVSSSDKTSVGREGAAKTADHSCSSSNVTGNELSSILSFGSSSDGFDRVFRQEVPSIDVDVDQLGVVHVFSSPSLVKTVAEQREQEEEDDKRKEEEDDVTEGIEVDFNYSGRMMTVADDNGDDNTIEKRKKQKQSSNSGNIYRHQDRDQDDMDESRGIYASSFGSLLNDMSKDDLECVGGDNAAGSMEAMDGTATNRHRDHPSTTTMTTTEEEETVVEPLSINSTIHNKQVSSVTQKSTLSSYTSNKIYAHHHTITESNSCPSDEDFGNDNDDDNETEESTTISETSEPSSIYDFFRSPKGDHIDESNQFHSLFDDDDDEYYEDDDDTNEYPFQTLETIIEEEYGGSWDSSTSAEEEPTGDDNVDALSLSERIEIENSQIKVETQTNDTQHALIETAEGDDDSTESQFVTTMAKEECIDETTQVPCVEIRQIADRDSLIEFQSDESLASDLNDDSQQRSPSTENNAVSVDSLLDKLEFSQGNNQIFPIVGFPYGPIEECIRQSVNSVHIKDATASYESSKEDRIGIIFERSAENTAVVITTADQMIRSSVPGVQFVGLSMLLARNRSVQISGQ